MNSKTMTVAEFRAAVYVQMVPREHIAVKCPLCGTIQSSRDFARAGAPVDRAGIADDLGSSCIGRFTGAGAPRRAPDGQPCDWTLNGAMQLHTLSIVEDGKAIPHFDIATPEEAQHHKAMADARDMPAPKPPYGFDDFFREAAALNLTVNDLLPALVARPEFADCLPPNTEKAKPQ